MSSKPLPHHGPQKNMEHELANTAATTGGGGPISKGLLEARGGINTAGQQVQNVPGSPNTSQYIHLNSE